MGSEAHQLLNGPVLTAAWDEVERLFVKEWRSTAPEDTKRREMCYAKLSGLDEVKRTLHRVVGNGEHASLTTDE